LFAPILTAYFVTRYRVSAHGRCKCVSDFQLLGPIWLQATARIAALEGKLSESRDAAESLGAELAQLITDLEDREQEIKVGYQTELVEWISRIDILDRNPACVA
jgi:hypothetical protein